MNKLIIIGANGVGKTTFVRRVITGEFESKHVPTLGVEVHPVRYPEGNSSTRFNMWDCAGDEKFRGLGSGYYKNATFAIVMFDVTSRESFKEVQSHIDEIRRVCDGIPIAILANKIDMKVIEIHPEYLYSLKDQKNMKVYQTSNKSCYNIYTSFGSSVQ